MDILKRIKVMVMFEELISNAPPILYNENDEYAIIEEGRNEVRSYISKYEEYDTRSLKTILRVVGELMDMYPNIDTESKYGIDKHVLGQALISIGDCAMEVLIRRGEFEEDARDDCQGCPNNHRCYIYEDHERWRSMK